MLEEEIVVGVFLNMQLAHTLIQQLAQLLNICATGGTDEQAVASQTSHPGAHEIRQGDVLAGGRSEVVGIRRNEGLGINLVEEDQRRLVGTAEVAERLLHHLDLFLEVGMRDIYDVNEQIGLAHFVKGALETVDQVSGQLTDETYGI